MKPGETLQEILLKEMARSQVKNPAFSLRAFARRLGMQPATVSELMRGKRRASRELAQKIMARLGIAPSEVEKVLSRIPARRKNQPSNPTNEVLAYSELRNDEYRIIADWYHFAILSLVEVEDYQHDAHWIAKRLGIPVRDARGALERMTELGFLGVDEHGQTWKRAANFTTTDGVADLSLRKAHATNLALAQASLESDPVDLRDFTAVTMTIDPNDLPEAKRMLRDFRDRFCAHLERGRKTAVYKLCLQLIPLTRNHFPKEKKDTL